MDKSNSSCLMTKKEKTTICVKTRAAERLTCKRKICIMKSYGITMNKILIKVCGQEDAH